MILTVYYKKFVNNFIIVEDFYVFKCNINQIPVTDYKGSSF